MNKLPKYRNCGSIKTTITGKLLYLMLEDLADKNGSVLISQRKISNTLKISRSTISRNLQRLKRAGAISITPTFHYDGGRASNRYTIK